MFFFKKLPRVLATPHIRLGCPLPEAISILKTVNCELEAMTGPEPGLVAHGARFSVGVYASGDVVESSWYDDQAGRPSIKGKAAKTALYLARYGELRDWELRIENGWMQHWFNPVAGAHLVYGVRMDVIRINTYTVANSPEWI